MPIVRLSVNQWSQPHLSTCIHMELPRGEGRTICTPCKEVFPIESFTLDYHNGLDVSRGENPLSIIN